MSKFNVGDVVTCTTTRDGDVVAAECVVTRTNGNQVWLTEKPAVYNGKVVCVDNAGQTHRYTIGKIYTFVDGYVVNNHDTQPKSRPIKDFADWVEFSDAKWVELVED